MDAATSSVDKARLLAADFAKRAAAHDRDASFPFENFQQLFDAGLLSLTVPRERGGLGAGMLESARVLNQLARGCASTALVLAMHYIQHHSMAHGRPWPKHLVELMREGVSVGSRRWSTCCGSSRNWDRLRAAARMATVARRTAEGWRLTGHKIYSTGLPILKWYSVWARTDEAEPRLGTFLVPAGLAGRENRRDLGPRRAAGERQPRPGAGGCADPARLRDRRSHAR